MYNMKKKKSVNIMIVNIKLLNVNNDCSLPNVLYYYVT